MHAHPRPSAPFRRPGRRLAVATVAAVATVGMVSAALAQPVLAAEDRYRVRRGDTLSDIGQEIGVSARALARANGVSDLDLVYSGTWLRIPGPTSGRSTPATTQGRHRVRSGEVLGEIAARFGLTATALAAANGLRNVNHVVIGTVLTIPAAASSSRGTAGAPDAGLPSRLRASPSRLALLPLFDRWAARYGVPADLLKAMTWLESGWQQGVVSSTGAVGIGQLMPDTVTTMSDLLGVRLDPGVPEQNIRMSARYLRLLLDVTGGSVSRSLAGYYQGLASIQRRGVYPSTLAYVELVVALRSRF